MCIAAIIDRIAEPEDFRRDGLIIFIISSICFTGAMLFTRDIIFQAISGKGGSFSAAATMS